MHENSCKTLLRMMENENLLTNIPTDLNICLLHTKLRFLNKREAQKEHVPADSYIWKC